MDPGLGGGHEDREEIYKVNEATLDLETEQTWPDAEGAVKCGLATGGWCCLY